MTIEQQIYDLVVKANKDDPMRYVQNIVKPLARQALDNAILECDACDICNNSVKSITKGNPNAPILILGESVSKEQQEAGQNVYALEDNAGNILNDVLKYLGVGEDKVFYINSVNCHPTRNGIKRSSTVAERRECKTFLDYAVNMVEPLLIICLGAVAVNGINEEIGKQKINDIRGTYFQYRGITVMPTFHPGYFIELRDKVSEEVIDTYHNEFINDIEKAITDLDMQYPDLKIINK